MELQQLGWDSARQESFARFFSEHLFPARVSFAARDRWRILDAHGECAATLAGKARNDPQTPPPVVGDWVACRRVDADSAVIHAVLPRHGVLARGGPGGRKTADGGSSGEQVLAANVSVGLIVCGLDRDFNPRRIERYVALCYGGGVQPFVLLNKADLCPDAEEKTLAVESVAPGVEVIPLCARRPEDVENVRRHLRPGDTLCLLGSSGAGKSTLLNALDPERTRKTQNTSAATGKGRHTTTHRELFVLAGGLVVIDTPGLREVALADGEGVEQTFPEVEALSMQCRFRDCSHEEEPGCAVLAAVEDGDLPRERLESYRRLMREVRYRELAADTSKSVVEKSRWKSVSKAIKQLYKSK